MPGVGERLPLDAWRATGEAPPDERTFPAIRAAWRPYVQQLAEALRDEGAEDEARDLEWCGRSIRTHVCECSHTNRVHAIGCGSRVCAFCERKAARKRVKRATRGMQRLPTRTPHRMACALAGMPSAVAECERLIAYWSDARREAIERATQLREQGRDDAKPRAYAARAGALVRERVAERARLARWSQQLRRPDDWRWREITLGVIWSPSDPAAWSVAGMRARIESLRRQWAALWAEINVAGVAAYVAAVEMSANGHIHMHVAYFGPWLAAQKKNGAPSWASRIVREAVEDAGAVMVGAAYGGNTGEAVEVLKYATKGGSGGDPMWLAGVRRIVAHPVAAARWSLALRGVQRITYSASLRGLMGTDAADQDERAGLCCEKCKAALPALHLWDRQWADEFARALVWQSGLDWRPTAAADAASLRNRRDTIRAEAMTRWRTSVRAVSVTT